MANAEYALKAQAVALPLPALVEQSLSDRSSQIFASLLSRRRRRLAAVSTMVIERSSAHAAARSGSLWTRSGVALDLANAHRRAACTGHTMPVV